MSLQLHVWPGLPRFTEPVPDCAVHTVHGPKQLADSRGKNGYKNVVIAETKREGVSWQTGCFASEVTP